jgi:hypothetical protein
MAAIQDPNLNREAAGSVEQGHAQMFTSSMAAAEKDKVRYPVLSLTQFETYSLIAQESVSVSLLKGCGQCFWIR